MLRHVRLPTRLLGRSDSLTCHSRLLSTSIGGNPGSLFKLSDILQGNEHVAFDRIVSARSRCRSFKDAPVPDSLIKKILEQTSRAPSGFNLQPWKIVLVDDKRVKERLSRGMLGGNAPRVHRSPLVAVFVADTQAIKNIDKIIEMERKRGATIDYLRNLRMNASVYAGDGSGLPINKAFRSVVGATKLLSPVPVPLPFPKDPETWAIKQTMLVAMTYMLSCTAHGLGTYPMEGIDEDMVRKVLNIPSNEPAVCSSRYSIPLVVATGFPAESISDDSFHQKSPRYSVEEIVRKNHFEKPFDCKE